jgi:hypothetical protein
MSEPVVAYRRGRTSFSLGLAAVSAAVLFALGGYDDFFVPALAFPSAVMAIGGFFAYMLTEWPERANLGARLARVLALTVISPLIAFLIAAGVIGLISPVIMMAVVQIGPMLFVVPALLTTFAWSLLHVFVIRPWLSRQADTVRVQ